MTINTINADGKIYIEESQVWLLLSRMRRLVTDQRKALRTHDKELREDCMKREDGLIKFVDGYEAIRSKTNQLNLFDSKN